MSKSRSKLTFSSPSEHCRLLSTLRKERLQSWWINTVISNILPLEFQNVRFFIKLLIQILSYYNFRVKISNQFLYYDIIIVRYYLKFIGDFYGRVDYNICYFYHGYNIYIIIIIMIVPKHSSLNWTHSILTFAKAGRAMGGGGLIPVGIGGAGL